MWERLSAANLMVAAESRSHCRLILWNLNCPDIRIIYFIFPYTSAFLPWKLFRVYELMNIRRITSLTALLSFILLFITIVVLYIVPRRKRHEMGVKSSSMIKNVGIFSPLPAFNLRSSLSLLIWRTPCKWGVRPWKRGWAWRQGLSKSWLTS